MGAENEMKIIDAHLHFFPKGERFTETAAAAGHLPTMDHLTAVMKANDIVLGIGMGTTPMDAGCPALLQLPFPSSQWPEKFVQCLGIAADAITKDNRQAVLTSFETEISCPNTVGIKVYAGYQPFFVNDPVYHPFYELAEQYDVPVVIHTGDTATATGRLKFAQPLTVDEAAVNFPRVNFVMAHFGNPWVDDAAEVLRKNPNVYADLSGLVEGDFSAGDFWGEYRAYMDRMAMWLGYAGSYEKLLYGSDWPLVNIPAYIELIARLIPAQHHEDVFFGNACRLFKKIKPAVGLE